MRRFVVVGVVAWAAIILFDGGHGVHAGSQDVTSYLEVVKCAGQMNFGCVLDKSEHILKDKSRRFLDEADAAVTLTGRKSDSTEKPSELMDSISNIISEVTKMFFKDGIAGFFRDGKEDNSEETEDDDDDEDDLFGDDDDEDDDEDEKEKTQLTASKKPKSDKVKARSLRKDASEARKKKKGKKEKLKAIIKLAILGAVLFLKLTLLLKVLAAHLQLKFLAIAAAGLLINVARFYLDLKKGHHPQKVIYYEHAQHQHHYDHDEDWGGSSHGGYWGRSYEDDEEKAASPQDIAYRRQKNEEESSSWF